MCGVCGIRFGEMCVSMDKNILFRMPGGTGKETEGGRSRKSISGHNVVFPVGR